ncbi:Predicted phosphohydrolase, MPP superfamily [Paenibacillus sophorae]|uniref:Metallophosphoesterase family protein n=1 Tax=Paenibacillus sophorae TaxID=1333845 RepID=A0A1H8NE86_9BACL|nr:metallophosphoesterase [Paenibacillus sophorae]QWU14662.1 metallophosphoesterase family protein [Paenibacillus sophorae]SEO27852.1 Predicted phosphohydrolase, MPP superfamily [Paenibacillus sophorae]
MVAGLAGLLAAAGVVAFGAAMLSGACRSRLAETDIELETLPRAFEGYRILLVTDIHRRILPRKRLSSLKGQIDIVLLGGDMTEKNSPLKRLDDNMALLASIGPVYAVHGNHDYKADIVEVDRILEQNGVRLLTDENVALERERTTLWLTGVDHPRKGGRLGFAPLPDLPAGAEKECRIILVHDPMWLMRLSNVPADLILSGHTHGGQVVLPIIGLRHVEDFYRTYSAGMYRWPKGDDTDREAMLLISRGFGTAHLPLRFRSPAELHILTLRRPASGVSEIRLIP